MWPRGIFPPNRQADELYSKLIMGHPVSIGNLDPLKRCFALRHLLMLERFRSRQTTNERFAFMFSFNNEYIEKNSAK